MDELDLLGEIRASLALAEQQIDRGDFVVWTPELMDRLSEEADEMDRQGQGPHRDVCP